MVELHRLGARVQRLRLRRRHDLEGRVEQLDDASPAGESVLQVVEDLGGRLNGLREEVGEEHEGGDLTDRHVSVGAHPRTRDDDEDERGAGDALARHERTHGTDLRPDGGLALRLDRIVHALLGARLNTEQADGRCPGHGLRDRAQHVGHPLADDGVRAPDEPLEVAQEEEQRQEADPHEDGERPRVPEHEDRRDEQLPDGDDEHHAAALDEHRDLVDVARHARNHRTAAGRVERQRRQGVHVGERLAAQRRQPPLGRAEEPDVHDVGADTRHDDAEGREGTRPPHDAEIDPARREDAVVDGALERQRHDDLARRGHEREQQRPAEALRHLRSER